MKNKLLILVVMGFLVPSLGTFNAQADDNPATQKQLDAIVSHLRQIRADEQQLAMAQEDLHKTMVSGGSVFILSALAAVALYGAFHSTGEAPGRISGLFRLGSRKPVASTTEAAAAAAAEVGSADEGSIGGDTIHVGQGGEAYVGPTAEDGVTGIAPDFEADPSGMPVDPPVVTPPRKRGIIARVLGGTFTRRFGLVSASTVAGTSLLFTGADLVRVQNEISEARSILAQEESDLTALTNAAKYR